MNQDTIQLKYEKMLLVKQRFVGADERRESRMPPGCCVDGRPGRQWKQRPSVKRGNSSREPTQGTAWAKASNASDTRPWLGFDHAGPRLCITCGISRRLNSCQTRAARI
uniref:Uncharacterized protein n=1 Tax=Cryptomonas curvata TaxID=233186 RepID=A0A7S0LTL3_9CRYP|mmetsp:Transcript_10174/g.21722  ORF Transcript_10174/g.21722 Transcript_10174/m.21722 type:complete len:109 (+) Transcript_10174:335-661(+)